jgi:sugar lactone lactonase YvrE
MENTLFELSTAWTSLSSMPQQVPWYGPRALKGSFHLGEGHSDPAGLTTDAKGNMFIAEQQNNCMLVFHLHGGMPLVVGGGAEASLKHIQSPIAIAVVGNHIFVANKGNTIHVFAFVH